MKSDKMPVVFIGHGSPMNAIVQNDYNRDLISCAKKLSRPRAILVVSAHWLTTGTFITGAGEPEQIYDFWGFPQAIYSIVYRAPGSPTVAEDIVKWSDTDQIKIDSLRGIDHAAWAVLKYLFPKADVPVLELSLDTEQDADYHYQLGKKMRVLRDEGILIIGSGNIVHNLREIEYEEYTVPYPWAVEFDHFVKDALLSRDDDSLINYLENGDAEKAVPTNDHYLPMLYVLAALDEHEKIEFVHESMQNASISMRSFCTQ
jgi:4,5-DOPA dioxygenase extradiol